MIDQAFKDRLTALLPELIAFRHDLHAHPEIAYKEKRTAAKVAEWLGRIPGVTFEAGIAETGIVATLAADKDGPCLAFRADMDALPLEDKCGKPYASTIPGMAHACGHDGHTTCLLGALIMMAENTDKLAGPVRFIFQPAEEGEAGAQRMVAAGVLENPTPAAIFGLHGWPSLPVGTIGLHSGPFMASTDHINISIGGKGAHAAYPHRGVDPIVAAAQVVLSLQTLVSRYRDPVDPAVITIGSFHGGTARNIIPDEVTMRGTLRTLSESLRRELRREIKDLVTRTASALRATAEIEVIEGYPVTVNNPEMVDFIRGASLALLGAERVVEVGQAMVAEDFAYYARQIPGCFFCLGMTPDTGEEYPGLHNPAYDFNDDAIVTAISLFCTAAWSWPR